MGLSIIGAGEVGGVFARAAEAAGLELRQIRRGEAPVDRALSEGPLLVAVREGDLAALVPQLTTLALRSVFVQNGWVEPLLDPLGPITRGLLWFTKKGSFEKVLRPSIFRGPQAAHVVAMLNAAGIAARVEPRAVEFGRELAYKLAWNGVVGLPLAVHRVDLATYLAGHAEEARAIVSETCQVLEAELGGSIDAARAIELLEQTTGALGWMSGGAKALEFRNGAVQSLGRRRGIPTPVHDQLLAAVRFKPE